MKIKIENDEKLDEALKEIERLWRLNDDGLLDEKMQKEFEDLCLAVEFYEDSQGWFD